MARKAGVGDGVVIDSLINTVLDKIKAIL